jgi:hypothetical protein
LWASYAPAAFASLGVTLAIGATRRALLGQVTTMLVFAAELAAGALMLALCIRFCPLPGICRELRMRLAAAGVLGAAGGWRRWSSAGRSPHPSGCRDRAAAARVGAAGRRGRYRGG